MTIFLDVSKIAPYGLKCRWRIIQFLFAGNPFYSQISISLTGGNHGVWSLDARLIRAPSKKGICVFFPFLLQIFIFEFFLKREDLRFFNLEIRRKNFVDSYLSSQNFLVVEMKMLNIITSARWNFSWKNDFWCNENYFFLEISK